MVGLDSPWHWLVLVGVVLLLFGPKRLPGAARSLGSGIREVKESISGLTDMTTKDVEPATPVRAELEASPTRAGTTPAPTDRDTLL